MSCLGVHFSLSEEEVRKLKSFNDDSARLDHLQCEIEEKYFEEHEDRVAAVKQSVGWCDGCREAWVSKAEEDFEYTCFTADQ